MQVGGGFGFRSFFFLYQCVLTLMRGIPPESCVCARARSSSIDAAQRRCASSQRQTSGFLRVGLAPHAPARVLNRHTPVRASMFRREPR